MLDAQDRKLFTPCKSGKVCPMYTLYSLVACNCEAQLTVSPSLTWPRHFCAVVCIMSMLMWAHIRGSQGNTWPRFGSLGAMLGEQHGKQCHVLQAELSPMGQPEGES